MSFKQIIKRILSHLRGGGVLLLANKIQETLRPVRGKGNTIRITGDARQIKKTVFGNNNEVVIKNSTLISTVIRIRGNNNRLVINEGCFIGRQCSFWLEGNGNSIVVGKKTTMTQKCHFNAQEHNTQIIIGEDCMFSNTIVVRTSDSHPIYDNDGVRLNPAKNVKIGNHVWIAPSSVVMKGAEINDGCVVGSHSMVNKIIPKNCLVVGMPARIVKENIHWTREDIIY